MRGKVLFDVSGENDKLVLIQSALLLSFWFDDAEDIKQSWYWSSIAFGFAQTLGLHRVPVPETQQISKAEHDIWRNLWHCCIFRDAWLSYTMGRPLRLDEAACTASLPLIADCGFRDVKLRGSSIYSEAEAEGHLSSRSASETVCKCKKTPAQVCYFRCAAATYSFVKTLQ
ncbi:hypothetical protein QQZ08_007461 [Neonectria magnoliae]|uniref:Xylanolytic transcriptional activator regulatory domain-containing protein n=1 Tax=Neonectria magnoliae TaxID=2732573 RepID=A0ABR1HXT0_9HYPO